MERRTLMKPLAVIRTVLILLVLLIFLVNRPGGPVSADGDNPPATNEPTPTTTLTPTPDEPTPTATPTLSPDGSPTGPDQSGPDGSTSGWG